MNTRSLAVVPVLGLLLSLGLPALAIAHGDEPHGDHDAQHGGFVMMYENLHFEVTAAPAGIQLYFTDAQRSELPAATVSDVAVEIERKGMPIESVVMAISAGGDYWEGSSKPVTEADQLDLALHDRVLAEGLAAADKAGIIGKDVTPFLLDWFHTKTNNQSLEVNVTLINANARLAAEIAVAALKS